jgi:hypothetical protein
MKKIIFFIFIVLSIQSWTKADDIKDFEIEGMSIGDSALKFITEEEIIKNIRQNGYKGSDGKFYDTSMYNSLKQYDEVALILKKNDKKFIIYGLEGVIYYGKDSQSCTEQYKIIVDEFNNIFKDYEKIVDKNLKHPTDPSGQSLVDQTSFFLTKNNSGAVVACYRWSEEMNLEHYLSVALDSDEFGKWLDNYYK